MNLVTECLSVFEILWLHTDRLIDKQRNKQTNGWTAVKILQPSSLVARLAIIRVKTLDVALAPMGYCVSPGSVPQYMWYAREYF